MENVHLFQMKGLCYVCIYIMYVFILCMYLYYVCIYIMYVFIFYFCNVLYHSSKMGLIIMTLIRSLMRIVDFTH